MPPKARSGSASRGHGRSRSRSPTPVGARLHAQCVATVRCLSADQPTIGKSGHPGAPLGCAPMAHILWGMVMNYSPKDPKFANRDRFILSNGHASALQYSMIHLTGYDLPIAELEKFRKLHSRCPGHPENFMTPGIEVTTGPLGQGISNAVGMALGRAHLAACFNRPGFSLFDHSVYCICGDGCLMEGMSSEACALAGLLALPNLVVLWDDNNISIDGSTEIAFTEDVMKRFEAHGWEVSHVEDGDTDNEAIFAAVLRARAAGRPSLIRVSTTIGFGSVKAATHHIHGAPLAVDDLQQLRKASGFPEDKGFCQRGRNSHGLCPAVFFFFIQSYWWWRKLCKSRGFSGFSHGSVVGGVEWREDEVECLCFLYVSGWLSLSLSLSLRLCLFLDTKVVQNYVNRDARWKGDGL